MKYYAAKKKKFREGEIIFRENSDGDAMYIIDAGRVRVFKTVDSGANSREVELCTLGARAMFGEMAMLDNSKRSASVQAVEPTECTLITRQVFDDQLTRIPPWMVNLIRILVKRLRVTNEKLRTTVEQYTSLPGDGPDSVILIDAERTFTVLDDPAGSGTNPAGDTEKPVVAPAPAQAVS